MNFIKADGSQTPSSQTKRSIKRSNVERNEATSSPPGVFLTQSESTDRPKTPYEDRLIPTLRNNKGGRASVVNGNLDESLLNTTVNGILPAIDSAVEEQPDVFDPTNDGTEEMTERDMREAAQMNDSLGKQIVIKIRYID